MKLLNFMHLLILEVLNFMGKDELEMFLKDKN